MLNILHDNQEKIEVIIVNNDDMALGAIDALKKMDIPQEECPSIIGIDGTKVGRESIKIAR